MTENVAKTIALNEEGSNISDVLDIACNTINDDIRRYYETGEYKKHQGSGNSLYQFVVLITLKISSGLQQLFLIV